MGTNAFTLYFRQIPEDFDKDSLRELFSKYGEVVHMFVHHNGQYGMVEYSDIRSCDKAIESLHFTKPLNMYVSMARNQEKREVTSHNTRDSDTDSLSSGKNFNNPRRQRPQFNQNTSNFNNSAMNSSQIVDDTDSNEIIYIDRFGNPMNVFEDENGVIYAPLHQVTGYKTYRRKNPALVEDFVSNPKNFELLENNRGNNIETQPNEKQNFNQNRQFNQDRQFNQERPFNQDRSFNQERPFNQDRPQRPVQERNNYRQSENSRFERQPRFNNNNENTKNTSRVSFKNQEEDDWSGSENTKKPAPIPKPSPINPNQSSNSNFNSSRNNFAQKQSITVPPPITNGIQTSVVQKPDLKYNYITLPLGKTVEICITDMENNEIWVQNATKVEYAAEISLQAGEEIKDAEIISNPQVGHPCLGKFEGLWFRAVVINTNPLKVRYVDFGNVEEKPVEIRAISKKLCDIPAQAVQIKFKGKIPTLEVNQSLEIEVVEIINRVYMVKMPGEIIESAIRRSPMKTVQKTTICLEEALIYSKLSIGDDGMLMITKIVSPGKFVAGIMPTSFADELATLEKMSTERPRETTLNPKVGDLIFAKNNTDGYCRAILMEQTDDSYKVGFIDYGNEAIVKEVFPVPKELALIPWLTCVCTVPNQFAAKFTKPTEINFQVVTISHDSAVVQLLNESDEICMGQITVWDPTEKEKPDNSSLINNVTNKPQKQRDVLKLKNGEDVSLIHEQGGFLFLQNKEGEAILNKVERLLENHVKSASNLKTAPTLGQLVAAPFQDGYYRAVITNLTADKADIMFVDYGNTDTTQWIKFKILSPELNDLPFTLIKVRFKDHNGKFTKEEIDRLTDLYEKEGKFKASFENFDEGIDLLTNDGRNVVSVIKTSTPKRLSKFIKSLTPKVEVKTNKFRIPDDNDPIVLVTQLPMADIEIKKQEIHILSVINYEGGILTFCLNDQTNMNKIFIDLSADIQTYANNLPDKPYQGTTDEIVLVKSDNEWRRGLFMDGADDCCVVFCVDHGNMVETSTKNIRRLSPDMTKNQSLAAFGILSEVPTNLDETQLTNLVVGKNFMANIVSKEDDSYILDIPSLSKA